MNPAIWLPLFFSWFGHRPRAPIRVTNDRVPTVMAAVRVSDLARLVMDLDRRVKALEEKQ